MDMLKALEQIEVKDENGYTELTLPVVLNVACTLLTLRIENTSSGYTVLSPLDMFSEANGTQERYFSIYEKCDGGYHYEMRLNAEGLVYKEYPEDYNPVCAVDEFVRFFVAFDDFIIQNDVIGNEERFEN